MIVTYVRVANTSTPEGGTAHDLDAAGSYAVELAGAMLTVGQAAPLPEVEEARGYKAGDLLQVTFEKVGYVPNGGPTA